MPHLHHASASFGPAAITVIIVFTALLYLDGWISLRSNSPVSAWRTSSFLIGLFLIWTAVASPVSALDHELLTVHMLKHLLLMTFAPPLIWLGEPVRYIRWAFPPSIRRTRTFAPPGTRQMLAICWLAAAAALLVWHVPSVFALTMHSPALHFVEQASFLVTGLLFWWPVIQPWPSAPESDLSMILYLFFATLPCDVLAGFLVFCDRVVYTDYLSSSHLSGFTAIDDQQCAAALMWTSVTLVYLLAGTILAMRMLSPQKHLDAKITQHVHPTSPNIPPRLEAI
ncbi:MAG TPA: cytochrome c oxidase assembly protein [Terriglobales bacterium]|nr:cytochrome c oxidase assembly protein [Terriglobales bacterium]